MIRISRRVVARALVVVAGAMALLIVGLWLAGADFYYGDRLDAFAVEGEAPHVFAAGDEWVVQTVRGSRESGFAVDEQRHASHRPFTIHVEFPRDSTRFSVVVRDSFETPPSRYDDNEPVVAISDIEGNFVAFRDFLIASKVVDSNLNWTFGKGHLVLVGDFVDRGPSVTHVLWLIYRLEQLAIEQGGRVHFVLGNHEIKNLQGDFQASHRIHGIVSVVLGRPQAELFGNDAFLGRWLMSHNVAEVINGTLFVHGGVHPSLADRSYSLDDVNRIVRAKYRRVWYPVRGGAYDDVLLDPATGPAWYRGYFKADLAQADVAKSLARFNATSVVVGHTIQSRVKSKFERAVIAIDVKHPWDYRTGVPSRRSEGLRLEGGRVWRVLDDGKRVAL